MRHRPEAATAEMAALPAQDNTISTLADAVKISLVNIHPRDGSYSQECILTPEQPTLVIGRKSVRGEHRGPASAFNICFDSPVVSREHAQLSYDPITRHVYIHDLGSMHGTTLNGTALEQTQKRLVESGDNVVVGSDVILGTKHHYARRFQVLCTWQSQSADPVASAVTASPPTQFPAPSLEMNLATSPRIPGAFTTKSNPSALGSEIFERSKLLNTLEKFRRDNLEPGPQSLDGPGGSQANPVTIDDDEQPIIDLTKPAEMIDLSQDDEASDWGQLHADVPINTTAVPLAGPVETLDSAITEMANMRPDSLSTDFEATSPDTDSEAEDEDGATYDIYGNEVYSDISDAELKDTLHSGTLGDSEVGESDSEMEASLDIDHSDDGEDRLVDEAPWNEDEDDVDLDPYDQSSEDGEVAENEMEDLQEQHQGQDAIMYCRDEFNISASEAQDLQADIKSYQAPMEHFQEHQKYVSHRAAQKNQQEVQNSELEGLTQAAFSGHEEYFAQRVLTMSPPAPLVIDFKDWETKDNVSESGMSESDHDAEQDEDDDNEDDEDSVPPSCTPLSPVCSSKEMSPPPLSFASKHEDKRKQLLFALFPEDYSHNANSEMAVDLESGNGKQNSLQILAPHKPSSADVVFQPAAIVQSAASLDLPRTLDAIKRQMLHAVQKKDNEVENRGRPWQLRNHDNFAAASLKQCSPIDNQVQPVAAPRIYGGTPATCRPDDITPRAVCEKAVLDKARLDHSRAKPTYTNCPNLTPLSAGTSASNLPASFAFANVSSEGVTDLCYSKKTHDSSREYLRSEEAFREDMALLYPTASFQRKAESSWIVPIHQPVNIDAEQRSEGKSIFHHWDNPLEKLSAVPASQVSAVGAKGAGAAVLSIDNMLNKAGDKNEGPKKTTDIKIAGQDSSDFSNNFPLREPTIYNSLLHPEEKAEPVTKAGLSPKVSPNAVQTVPTRRGMSSNAYVQDLAARVVALNAHADSLRHAMDKGLDRGLDSIHVPSQASTSPPLLAHSVVLKDASMLSPSRKRKAEELSSGVEEKVLFGNKTDRINHTLPQVEANPGQAAMSKEATIQPASKRARIMSAARPYFIGALAGSVGVITALVTLPESFF